MRDIGPDVNGHRRQMRIVFSETPPSVHSIVDGVTMESAISRASRHEPVNASLGF
jgi:hypothetical protein